VVVVAVVVVVVVVVVAGMVAGVVAGVAVGVTIGVVMVVVLSVRSISTLVTVGVGCRCLDPWALPCLPPLALSPPLPLPLVRFPPRPRLARLR
jgi:hypothetical protein